MGLDEKIHEVFEALKKLNWHDFEDVGYTAPYNMYYYAEDRLYIILDCMVESYWFVEADSPVKALQICMERIDEASKAGSYVDEEVY